MNAEPLINAAALSFTIVWQAVVLIKMVALYGHYRREGQARP